MQACKNLCMVLLRIKGGVHNFELTSGKLLQFEAWEPQLLQMGRDLHTACTAINMANIQSSSLNNEHVQIIKCFAGLVTVVIQKFELLEDMYAAGLGRISSRGAAVIDMSHHLWAFLVNSCSAFQRLPVVWPVRDVAEYGSIRDALYRMVRFLINSSRSSGSIWHAMMAKISPNVTHDHTTTVNSASISYLTSISKSPAHVMLREFAALPTDFISLVCCLVLEKVNSGPPVAVHGFALLENNIPAVPRFLEVDVPIISLCKSLNDMALIGIVGDRSCRPSCCLFTPAVAHLFKRVLIILHERPRTGLHHNDEDSTVLILTLLLAHSRERNTRDPDLTLAGGDLRLHSVECSEPQLLSWCKPTVRLSDVRLLRALTGHKPADATILQQRYQLVETLLMGWQKDRQGYTPFPSPSAYVQTKGIYVVAHHCCVESVAWMRQVQQQRQQKQQLQLVQQPRNTARVSMGACDQPRLAAGVQQLVMLIQQKIDLQPSPLESLANPQGASTLFVLCSGLLEELELSCHTQSNCLPCMSHLSLR